MSDSPKRRRRTWPQRIVLVVNLVVIMSCFVAAGVLYYGSEKANDRKVVSLANVTKLTVPGSSVPGITPDSSPDETLVAGPVDMTARNFLITGSDNAQGATNVYQGRYHVESSPYMENSAYTGYSTAAWYLLANPADLSAIEVVFLNGRDTPTVETAEADFNVLGIQMRGVLDFGVALQEYRAGVRSAGS